MLINHGLSRNVACSPPSSHVPISAKSMATPPEQRKVPRRDFREIKHFGVETVHGCRERFVHVQTKEHRLKSANWNGICDRCQEGILI